MTSPLVGRLDAFGRWRQALAAHVDALSRDLDEHELLDATAVELLGALRQRLAGDKLVLAVVAEFSRGKSELINALFFGEAGRRVLPATPGRTTMCPVELGCEPGEPPALALLPIETRLDGRTLAELRQQPAAWLVTPLDARDPERLCAALAEVTRTRRASVDEARALGFWDDAAGADNPPLANGRVEVPLWRHALINYPHPLLERGLVVLDTPGLNAIGAEPELTLGLLPGAHATVFLLGADTGVTRSDLAIWRDHLAAPERTRFVALNKIDTLADPLGGADQWQQQVERQRQVSAQVLGVEPARVFPVSARQALAARIAGDAGALTASGLPQLEAALAAQLLPLQRETVHAWMVSGARALEAHLERALADRRRQLAEQLLELRGLRGKSGAKLRLMLERVDADAAEFERCTARVHAMRAVHARMLHEALAALDGERLRGQVFGLQGSLAATLAGLGARGAFVRLAGALRAQLDEVRRRHEEIHAMLAASFALLNSDFGFALALPTPPDLSACAADLDAVERSYAHYLGLGHALRLSRPGFMEQFRRMLLARLQPVFDAASGELERWNRAASTQIEAQLRERRRGFKRRRESLERIEGAAGELERRLSEFEAIEARLAQLRERVGAALRGLTLATPEDDDLPAAASAEAQRARA